MMALLLGRPGDGALHIIDKETLYARGVLRVVTMPQSTPRPPPSKLQVSVPHLDTRLLLHAVHINIDSARERVERSHQIVAHSRQLIDRVKLSLARSLRIQKKMARPGIPAIAPNNHRGPASE